MELLHVCISDDLCFKTIMSTEYVCTNDTSSSLLELPRSALNQISTVTHSESRSSLKLTGCMPCPIRYRVTILRCLHIRYKNLKEYVRTQYPATFIPYGCSRNKDQKGTHCRRNALI